LYELGWAFKSLQKDDEATNVFSELIKRSADSPLAAEAHYHLAQVDYAKGTYDKAAEHYEASIKGSTDESLKQKALYKLGWCYYQQENYEAASTRFAELAKLDEAGSMRIPALFMSGECEFKRDQFTAAMEFYLQARQSLEKLADRKSIPNQVQVLTYLHGAQCLREAKNWVEMEKWLQVILDRYSDSGYLAQTLYELGFCYQNQNKINEAIKAYSDVADKYRTEIAARSRFMLGELYFGQRDFAKAIPEFQRVMYGYGGESAPAEIKNWQARSAFEAGRCSEVLIADLGGEKKARAVKIATDFYQYVVDKHPQHELNEKAKSRLDALKQL
jgi:tetratricopeptide (TPR) repeat protein